MKLNLPSLARLPEIIQGGMGVGVSSWQLARAVSTAGQLGVVFALSKESGFDPALKARIIAAIRAGDLRIFTDPVASPTGFPFKVANIPDTLADTDIYDSRNRICDIGVLREPFIKTDGSVGLLTA